MTEQETDHEDHADTIVAFASRRGLGDRPRLQRASGVLWAGFLGACCLMAVVLLIPEDWLTAPVSFERLAAAFVVFWIQSLIPAWAASLLASPRQSGGKSESVDE